MESANEYLYNSISGCIANKVIDTRSYVSYFLNSLDALKGCYYSLSYSFYAKESQIPAHSFDSKGKARKVN